MRRRFTFVSLLLLLALAGGCGKQHSLMPTPNLYLGSSDDPFAEVPAELQSNEVDVIYVTDRKPENHDPNDPQYGYGRSRSVAFGKCTVRFGEDVSWEELVAASRTDRRGISLPLAVTRVHEIERLPETPAVLIPPPDNFQFEPPNWKKELEADTEAFRRQVAEALAKTSTKEAYVYVHGFANNFDSSARVIAQLWHFLGRRGVPIAYSWPAGSQGIKAYAYDRESGEFTIYHLKHFLRVLASCPDLERINIIAHSRGADVAATALRELHLEIRGAGGNTREELKLGALVLAAPDLDLDVVIQRMAAERVGAAFERGAIYVSLHDKAIGISSWLFGGLARLGRLRSDYFTVEELHAVRGHNIQVIEARITKAGSFGHNYFHSNPAVSSDVILLLRDRRPAKAEHGRPLGADESGFLYIDDDYPSTKEEP